MKKVLVLTLKVFSATGGIEKVCRVACKALYEMQLEGNMQPYVMSMHDKKKDAFNNPYVPTEIFEGFNARKGLFVTAALKKGIKADIVILSHVNLLLVGWLIKIFSPKTRVCLLAHGIEIWDPFRGLKKKMLFACDQLICVSNYTMDRIRENYPEKDLPCIVLNNCLDPFLPLPARERKQPALLQKLGYAPQDFIFFILTRLSAHDRYKGYDKVFQAMAELRMTYPNIRYLMGGGYDAGEKKFLDEAILSLQLQEVVNIAGYIPDAELADYFSVADAYLMPSKKEGFGIVFIEAMYYGLPVIAGNADGSADALLQGRLGQLVNPDSVAEIKLAIEKTINSKQLYQPDHDLLMSHFSYQTYKSNLSALCGERA